MSTLPSLSATQDFLSGTTASGETLKVHPQMAQLVAEAANGGYLGDWATAKAVYAGQNKKLPTACRVVGSNGHRYRLKPTGDSDINPVSANGSAHWVDEELDAPVWQQGTTSWITVGSDGKWYLANPSGNPANNDPINAANRPTHWQGPYSSFADLLKAILGSSSDSISKGVKVWTQGDSGANGNGIVLGSDGKWYLANPSGNPANNDPTVAANRPTHWQGGFESLGDLITAIVGVGVVPNGWSIVDANCATGMLKLKRPDGTTCTLFTKELEGVTLTAPATANAGQTGLAASVSTPSNGTAPYTYAWTLIDGSTANTQNITFTAPATAGSYTLKCVVTDANGMTVTKTQTVTVTALPEELAVVSGCSHTVALAHNPFEYKKIFVKVRSYACCSLQVANESEWVYDVAAKTLDYFGQSGGVDTGGERVVATAATAVTNTATAMKWTWEANWGDSNGRTYTRQFGLTTNSVTVSNSVEGTSDCILSVRGEA